MRNKNHNQPIIASSSSSENMRTVCNHRNTYFRVGKISIGRHRHHPKLSYEPIEDVSITSSGFPSSMITTSESNQNDYSVSVNDTNPNNTQQGMKQKRTLAVQTNLSSVNIGLESSLQLAYQMNEMGVSSFQDDPKNSEKCLHFLMEAKSWFEMAMNNHTGGELESCFHSTLSVDHPPVSSYIYQRVDFDEGMGCYSDLLHIHKEPSYCFFPENSLQSQCHENTKYCSCFTSKNYAASVGGTIFFNMGQVYQSEGEFKDALAMYHKALNVLESFSSIAPSVALDDDNHNQELLITHPLSVPILHKIGYMQYKHGDLNSSLASYSSALEILKRSSCNYSSDLAHTFNALGVLKYHEPTSDSTVALDYFQSALTIYKAVEGQQHSSVATVLNNIGRVHVHMHDFITALEFYDEALLIRKERLGQDSIDYAATAFNAAQSLHQLGDLEHALWLYREFLRVAVTHFSVNHRDVAVVLSGMAEIHQEKREYDLAESFFMQGIEAAKTALGECHSEVAMMLNRIGNFYFERNSLDKALQYYSEGLAIEVKVFDITHPNILVTLSNLGEIFRQQHEWEKALHLYHQVLDIQRVRCTKDSAETASTFYILGIIYDQKGYEKLALQYLREALKIRQSVLGDSHVDVASTLSSIGSILYKSNSLIEAMDYFHKCLTMRRLIHDPNHRDVAFTLYNIALVHQKRGMMTEAIDVLTEVLRIESICLGDDHRDVAITLFKLGEAYQNIDDYDRALYFYKRSLDVERKSVNQDAASIARILNEIGNVHLVRGDTAQMMLAFNEACRTFRQAGLSPDNLAIPWQHFPVSFHHYSQCAAPAA